MRPARRRSGQVLHARLPHTAWSNAGAQLRGGRVGWNPFQLRTDRRPVCCSALLGGFSRSAPTSELPAPHASTLRRPRPRPHRSETSRYRLSRGDAQGPAYCPSRPGSAPMVEEHPHPRQEGLVRRPSGYAPRSSSWIRDARHPRLRPLMETRRHTCDPARRSRRQQGSRSTGCAASPPLDRPSFPGPRGRAACNSRFPIRPTPALSCGAAGLGGIRFHSAPTAAPSAEAPCCAAFPSRHRPPDSMCLARHLFVAPDLERVAVRLCGADCQKATPKVIAHRSSWHGFAPIVEERTPIHVKSIS
jgi:hypothetical protein